MELEPSILMQSARIHGSLYDVIAFADPKGLGSNVQRNNEPLGETTLIVESKARRPSAEAKIHCCIALVSSGRQRAWFFAQDNPIGFRSRPKGKDICNELALVAG